MCNNTDLPELEIISLLEEQLPVYKLRADTIFGYDQDDWLRTPLLGPDAAVDLTTEQIEETLKYFCKFVMLRFQNIITRVCCCWRVTMRDLSGNVNVVEMREGVDSVDVFVSVGEPSDRGCQNKMNNCCLSHSG